MNFVVEIFFCLENNFTMNRIVLLKISVMNKSYSKKYNSRLRAQDFLISLVTGIQELAL